MGAARFGRVEWRGVWSTHEALLCLPPSRSLSLCVSYIGSEFPTGGRGKVHACLWTRTLSKMRSWHLAHLQFWTRSPRIPLQTLRPPPPPAVSATFPRACSSPCPPWMAQLLTKQGSCQAACLLDLWVSGGFEAHPYHSKKGVALQGDERAAWRVTLHAARGQQLVPCAPF